ncbi:hypothetical protein RN001_000075 [Aquatica leii]|uniref:ADAMTS/ADAMTS-like cysteine-rich domain-containing protein n=1 Tax=Aquatica leii TaxID=1421715 RepID=A0AAN7Q2L3_9COLE|nr:hypothetical protein RN001_000075 [Aquatica leii]
MCSAKLTPTVMSKQNVGYPLKIHQLFQERLAKNNLKSEGVWSPWSSWTPCSRSCGGGVSQQIRHCVPKNTRFSTNTDNQKRHRHKRKLSNHCVGLYKRYHLCNTQKCSKGRDFRSEQCSFFNKYPFKGRFYYWEPFLQGAEECALNCRPIGMGFYATLNKTVIDGTSCLHPLTATGKAAPRGTPGLCVEGCCKVSAV